MTHHLPMILAIDDNTDNLMTIGTALQGECDVVLATSGEEGLAVAAESPPDLILLDVMMPGMDGYETCRALKAAPRTRDIPVIFLSALGNHDAEYQGLSIGAVDYIAKPFDVVITRQRIRNHLERDRLRRQLERHRDQLEEQVRERTMSLAIAKEAAESANSAKTVFLRTMSHEMRTPLNGIFGMLALARARATEPKQITQLEKAEVSAAQLLTLVDKLLTAANLESGRLSLASTPFTLAEVMASLRASTGHAAEDKHLYLRFDVAPSLLELPVQGDPLRLAQILIDLVGNAIKFTAQGGVEVVVTARPAASDRVGLRFEVRDSGIGIAEAFHRRLFLPFEQHDDSMSRSYGGSGIGLALCRQLVTRMGGEIGVESEPGRGSVFWFTVDLARTETRLPSEQRGREETKNLLRERFSGVAVLLAEDDPVSAETIRNLLEEAGLDVYVASDGAEAVERANFTLFDLILMDIMMPKMSGIQATGAIRAIPQYQCIPILALTAHNFDEHRDECLRAGMNAHISKPITAQLLLQIVLEWLEWRHAQVAR